MFRLTQSPTRGDAALDRAAAMHSVVLMLLLAVGCKEQGPTGSGGPPTMQVVAIEVARQPVAEQLSLVGTLGANEMVEVKAEIDGVIQEILFEEGQAVESNRLMVRLDESKSASALAEAEANYKLSEANYNRAKQLLEDELISQQEYDQAAASFELNGATVGLRKRQLLDTQIRAPFGGIVGARQVSPGQVINRNTTLTWLVDLDPVKVEFNVPERFLGRVELGQTVEFPIVAYTGRVFRGEVYFISPYVETETRTALVKALLPNASHDLKPGMLATLDLTVRVRDDAVVIPEAALAQALDNSQARVYVIDDGQKAQLVTIDLGIRMPGLVEVTAGLQGGEQIIVEGIQKIGPGMPVRLGPPEAAQPYLDLLGAGRQPPPDVDETDEDAS